MPNASLCWNCQGPWHPGSCPEPDGFDVAHRMAESHLRRTHEKLARDLAPFYGFNLSGHLHGLWVVRTPKGKELKAETPAAVLELVRRAAGKAPAAPEQVGFRW